jgi:ankyrin repeat protein
MICLFIFIIFIAHYASSQLQHEGQRQDRRGHDRMTHKGPEPEDHAHSRLDADSNVRAGMGLNGEADIVMEKYEFPISDILVPVFWEDRAKRQQLPQLLATAAELGVSIDKKNLKGWSASIFAAEYGDMDAIEVLAEHGANINLQENDGWTPLMFACFHGNVPLIDKLISVYDADISILNHEGIGPATLLRRRGLSDFAETVTRRGLIGATERVPSSDPNQRNIILRLLRDSSSNPLHFDEYDLSAATADGTKTNNFADFQNSAGWSALHFCANAGDVLCVKTLLKTYGADINMQENDGWSALMFACFHGYLDSVSEILTYEGRLVRVEGNNGVFGKVDVGHKNARGMTALDLVRQRLAEVPRQEQENFESIYALLSTFSRPSAMFGTYGAEDSLAVHGGGRFRDNIYDAMQRVGTFFFGQKEGALLQ